jgi:hypothetical protein
MRMFENRLAGKIFRPKGDEVAGVGENYIMRSFTISMHQIFLGWLYQEE